MELRLIKTEAGYEQALAEIETLFDAQPDTPEGDRLEVLTTLVEAYEQEYHAITPPDPILTLPPDS
jgi:HTH-type transcriptional regulator / antitoxin HigA